MKWYVYAENFNNDEIVIVDIFDRSYGAKEEIENLLRETSEMNQDFEKELRSILMYYFWSKCEHEVVITSWPPMVSNREIDRLRQEQETKEYPYDSHNVRLQVGEKIDIYNQIQLNWEVFVSYIWSCKDEVE